MKRRAFNSFRAPADRLGGARPWLLTLLLAAPFCASANAVAANSLTAFFFIAGSTTENNRAHYPGTTARESLAHVTTHSEARNAGYSPPSPAVRPGAGGLVEGTNPRPHFAASFAQITSSPFSALTHSRVQLAGDDDNGRGDQGGASYHRRGDRSDARGDNAEQRQRIEDRRRRFEALPPNQQQRLIQARERFLQLPPEDRERLRQRWQQMSPEERRRWRESESHRD